MPRFQYDVVAWIKREAKISIDAPTEEQAYESLMNELDGISEDDLELFADSIETTDVSVDVSTVTET